MNKTNGATGRNLPIHHVIDYKDSLKDYDDIDPRLKKIIQFAPFPPTPAKVLESQKEFGVEQTIEWLIQFIRQDFPDYQFFELTLDYRENVLQCRKKYKRQLPAQFLRLWNGQS